MIVIVTPAGDATAAEAAIGSATARPVGRPSASKAVNGPGSAGETEIVAVAATVSTETVTAGDVTGGPVRPGVQGGMPLDAGGPRTRSGPERVRSTLLRRTCR